MAFEYEKQPWEEEIVGVDFSRRVPATTSITAYTVAVEETISPPGFQAGSYSPHLSGGTPALSGPGVDPARHKILSSLLTGGVNNFQYRVTFRVTLLDGQKKEEDVLVTVKET